MMCVKKADDAGIVPTGLGALVFDKRTKCVALVCAVGDMPIDMIFTGCL